ncbi:MAG TPA: serine/threonine-protein kinase [Polyangiaceae bacterium]|jgi:serine/threonine-protein kinase|nr:serine/threonine-protein kinase [Polyangiaceae bacterium]
MSDGRVIAERYRLEEILGRGGQATVHRAVDLQTGRRVAVKELNGELAREPTVVARMAREQQAMVALAGTNAVEFIDLCTSSEGSLCLVLELLEGRDLEAYLCELEREKRLLPVSEMVAIMQPVVETLDRAHAVGIVHRDLKPSNIFLLSDQLGGGSRLLDFGLAHLASAEALTAAGLIMGSPSYIAPESWAGIPGRAGSRADVYSLGVILFRMLAGRMPFTGKTLLEKMRNTTSADRPSLHELRNELPPQVDIWVERSLAVDPNDRFASPGACFGELLWALKLAPHPSEQRHMSLSREQADEVRAWLDTDAKHGESIPLPLLSIEPMPLSTDAPGDAGGSTALESLPYLSLEPAPASDSEPEAPQAAGRQDRATAPDRLKKEEPSYILPPIPKAPLLPDKETSTSFTRKEPLSTRAPSVVPEQSGVRTQDDWDDATRFYDRAGKILPTH